MSYKPNTINQEEKISNPEAEKIEEIHSEMARAPSPVTCRRGKISLIASVWRK